MYCANRTGVAKYPPLVIDLNIPQKFLESLLNVFTVATTIFCVAEIHGMYYKDKKLESIVNEINTLSRMFCYSVLSSKNVSALKCKLPFYFPVAWISS